MRINDAARNLSLAAVSVCVLALVGEGALRLGVALLSERSTRVDPWLGWYHQPNASGTKVLEGHRYRFGYNAHGFRRPEHEYVKPPGTRRIVVLGDSYVDGSEVGDEETFTWLLQQEHPGVEVINLGVYGFSTAQQLIALERHGLQYHPDDVLLVTMTNDYTDNLVNLSAFGPAPRYVMDGDSLILQGTDHPLAQAAFRATNLPVPGARFLHRHSYLYYALNHYIYQRLTAARIQAVIDSQANRLSQDDRTELYVRLVRRMRQVSERVGATFRVVFVYPRADLVNNESSPSAAVTRRFAALDIAYLDLFDQLRQAELASARSLYYIEDFHWNTAGHARMAKLLGEIVVQADGGDH